MKTTEAVPLAILTQAVNGPICCELLQIENRAVPSLTVSPPGEVTVAVNLTD